MAEDEAAGEIGAVFTKDVGQSEMHTDAGPDVGEVERRTMKVNGNKMSAETRGTLYETHIHCNVYGNLLWGCFMRRWCSGAYCRS